MQRKDKLDMRLPGKRVYAFFLLYAFSIIPVFLFSSNAFAVTEEDIFEHLGKGMEYDAAVAIRTNQDKFIKRVREKVRDHLKVVPKSFYGIDAYIDLVGDCGITQIQKYKLLNRNRNRKWLAGRPERQAICNLQTIISDHSGDADLSIDTIFRVMDRISANGLSLERLLKNCQLFLTGERTQVLEDDEYQFAKLTNSKLTPVSVFHRSLLDRYFTDLKKSNELVKIWYDTLMIVWIDICCYAHINYLDHWAIDRVQPPCIDWRSVELTPSCDCVTPGKTIFRSDDDMDGDNSNQDIVCGDEESQFQSTDSGDSAFIERSSTAEEMGSSDTQSIFEYENVAGRSGPTRRDRSRHRDHRYDRDMLTTVFGEVAAAPFQELQAELKKLVTRFGASDARLAVLEKSSENLPGIAERLTQIESQLSSLKEQQEQLPGSSKTLFVPVVPGARLTMQDGELHLVAGPKSTPVEKLYHTLLLQNPGFDKIAMSTPSSDVMQMVVDIPTALNPSLTNSPFLQAVSIGGSLVPVIQPAPLLQSSSQAYHVAMRIEH